MVKVKAPSVNGFGAFSVVLSMLAFCSCSDVLKLSAFTFDDHAKGGSGISGSDTSGGSGGSVLLPSHVGGADAGKGLGGREQASAGGGVGPDVSDIGGGKLGELGGTPVVSHGGVRSGAGGTTASDSSGGAGCSGENSAGDDSIDICSAGGRRAPSGGGGAHAGGTSSAGGGSAGALSRGGSTLGASGSGGVASGGVGSGGVGSGGVASGGVGGVGTGGVSTGSALDVTDETVYIFTPDRTCGGGFITNRWVITASSCVSCGRTPEEVWVQFGSISMRVREIVRHPAGDCAHSEPGSGPDILLLGLDEPMAIGGSVYGYRRNYWPEPTQHLLGRDFQVWCQGWFMTPEGAPSAPVLRRLEPSTWQLTLDMKYGDRSLGDQLWVRNSDMLHPLSGRILTPRDIGSGCWTTDGTWRYYIGVYTPAKPDTSGIGLTANQEARLSMLSDGSTRRFLEASLFSDTVWSGFSAGSAIVPAAVSREITDYLWIDETGHLVVRRRSREEMGETIDWGAPLGATLLVEKPGVLVNGDVISVWVRDTQRALWVRERTRNQWQDWQLVLLSRPESAVTPTRVGELIHLIAQDESGVGVFAALDNNFDVRSSWEYLPQKVAMTSPFTASVDRLYARGPGGWIQHYWRDPQGWTGGSDRWSQDVYGEPAAVGWNGNTVDLFYRNSIGHLAHMWMEFWLVIDPTPLDTGIALPGTTLAATTSGPGSIEIVARDGGTLHSVRYPR